MGLLGFFGALLVAGSLSDGNWEIQDKLALIVGCACLVVSIVDYELRTWHARSIQRDRVLHAGGSTIPPQGDDPRDNHPTP